MPWLNYGNATAPQHTIPPKDTNIIATAGIGAAGLWC